MFRLGKKHVKCKAEILTAEQNDSPSGVNKNSKKLILDNSRWEASLSSFFFF